MKSLRSILPLRLTLLLSLTLLLFSTCKKDNEEDCTTCQYEQGFEMVKDWMYFKTGSYWIYEEENSGAIDTMTVWDDWEGIAQDVNDAFYTYTISSYDGFNYRYNHNSSFTIHCLTEESCDCEKVLRAKGKAGNYIGEERNLIFPPILGNYSFPGAGVTTVTELIEQYEVLPGDTAAYVSVFEVEEDASEEGQNTRYSVAKHIGIIQRVLYEENKIWNLIEYDVIQ